VKEEMSVFEYKETIRQNDLTSVFEKIFLGGRDQETEEQAYSVVPASSEFTEVIED